MKTGYTILTIMKGGGGAYLRRIQVAMLTEGRYTMIYAWQGGGRRRNGSNGRLVLGTA